MGTLLSPDEVCNLIPGMTRPKLAQMRFAGVGPSYFKPTPKTVVYDEQVLLEWLQSTEQTGTATASRVVAHPRGTAVRVA